MLGEPDKLALGPASRQRALGETDDRAHALRIGSWQRELFNVWNPGDDLTQRKSSKIVNQGPTAPRVAHSAEK